MARNVALRPKTRLAVHRRIALGTWSPPDDPTVHGTLKLPVGPMQAYLKAVREATGQRVTLTVALAKAMGIVLREVPDSNVIIRWGKLYLRDDVDIFVHVALIDPKTGKHDLSGIKLHHVDQRSITDLARQLETSAAVVRQDKDPAMAASRRMMRATPQWLVRFALSFLAFVSYTLNINPKMFGAPRDPFGSVGITNVGSLGLDTAYVPLVPYSRLPIFLALGAVQEEAVVKDGIVTVAEMVGVHATFDHRILDGAHVGQMTDILRRIFSDPTAAFGPPEGA